VRIAKHEDGKYKGFAHVEFEDASSADNAVQMAGASLMDRVLRIDYSDARQGGR
jgi:RNA recognition motif-containing protein